MRTPFDSGFITLNDVRTEILPDETILQVASRNRIQIPTLCYDPRLSISGHCKVCLVEVDGKLKASCMTRAEHGMDRRDAFRQSCRDPEKTRSNHLEATQRRLRVLRAERILWTAGTCRCRGAGATDLYII